MDYIGLKCPVCGKPFTAEDDIVVCPECGAPYHRACYQEAGHCIFEEKHGTPDAWKPQSEEEPEAQSGKKCFRCGKINAENALFCDQCGQMLSEDAAGTPPPAPGSYVPYGKQTRNDAPPYQNPGMPNQPYGMPNQPMPFAIDPTGGVRPEEPIEADINAEDMAKFVQNNPQYYVPAFFNLKRYRRNRFNFAAFLFSGGWMLYRKQYKWGTIITVLQALVYVLSTYVSFCFTTPLITDLMRQIGVDLSTAYPTMEQSLEFMSLLMQQAPWQIFLIWVPSILSFVRLGIMLFTGFNGNRMYLNHCTSRIQTIRTENPDAADCAVRLQLQGGVNTSLAICLLVCYMIVIYLPQLLLY